MNPYAQNTFVDPSVPPVQDGYAPFGGHPPMYMPMAGYGAVPERGSKLQRVVQVIYIVWLMAVICYQLWVDFAIVPFLPRKTQFTGFAQGALHNDSIWILAPFPRFLVIWSQVALGILFLCIFAGSRRYSPVALLPALGGAIVSCTALILVYIWMIQPANPSDPSTMKGRVWDNFANNRDYCCGHQTSLEITGCPSLPDVCSQFLSTPPTSYPIGEHFIKFAVTFPVQIFTFLAAFFLSLSVPVGIPGGKPHAY
jgi:hypothetical protein